VGKPPTRKTWKLLTCRAVWTIRWRVYSVYAICFAEVLFAQNSSKNLKFFAHSLFLLPRSLNFRLFYINIRITNKWIHPGRRPCGGCNNNKYVYVLRDMSFSAVRYLNAWLLLGFFSLLYITHKILFSKKKNHVNIKKIKKKAWIKPGLFCRFCYDNNVVTVSLMAAVGDAAWNAHFSGAIKNV